MSNIPVFRPIISADEFSACTEALENGWLGMGSYVGDFEKNIKQFLSLNDRFPVALSTGHAALHLALLLIGVGDGDEVITPSFNNIADFQAIIATGASPVFCDICDNSLCIDLEKAERLINSKTKAIISMDYACQLCDHDKLEELSKKNSIRIIHDAAHSFGSKYKNKLIGSFSDICMFSFDPVKTITSIDGGILVVKSEEEQQIIQEMRLIGMGQPSKVMYQNKRAWTYDVSRLGFRYHMPNLHAAIGIAQLAKMEQISASRQETCRYYNNVLGRISDLNIPDTNFDNITPFLYYIRVAEDRRNALSDYLSKNGIDTGIHWQPGHLFTRFQDYPHDDLSVTNTICREILTIPLHSFMSDDIKSKIVKTIGDFFKNN